MQKVGRKLFGSWILVEILSLVVLVAVALAPVHIVGLSSERVLGTIEQQKVVSWFVNAHNRFASGTRDQESLDDYLNALRSLDYYACNLDDSLCSYKDAAQLLLAYFVHAYTREKVYAEWVPYEPQIQHAPDDGGIIVWYDRNRVIREELQLHISKTEAEKLIAETVSLKPRPPALQEVKYFPVYSRYLACTMCNKQGKVAILIGLSTPLLQDEKLWEEVVVGSKEEITKATWWRKTLLFETVYQIPPGDFVYYTDLQSTLR